MSKLNSEPIKIQIRDVYYNPIHNATIKIIERRSDKILYNQESANGEVILDDIENLKDCHAFKVEIQHSHYHSKPKTDSFCIREAHRGKYHTLEFHYQEKLLVSNVYVEIREQIQNTCEDNRANTICLPKRTYNIDNNTFAEQEALQAINHLQIYLKAYYNQDTIPNKDKQSNKQKQAYKEQKKETKWGIIIGNPNESQPVKDNVAFQILKNKDDYELKGEEIILNLKQEWLNQTIRIYAYIENPNHKVGNTLHIYAPIEYKEEGLVDVSGYVIGIVGVVGRNAIIKGVKFASELQGNRYVRRENRESQGIARESLNNKEAREWYVNTQLPKIKELGDKIITLEERARFHFNFRNQARKDTRDAMKDRKKAEELENDRKNKTWEEWIEYVKKRKGLTKMEDIYNYTIEASQRTNPDVNSKFGIKPQ
ncbi:hypothetical protein [Helicobacter fennelliae]|uniref:hypothetical protein n=3 Tax=Helicobacter fennelliae TaxID=215 RepID=UPI000E127D86|nr:hypothetical protein [Helicobacter fennelliae]STP07481.1 Uncharacterised protein [Helicobacter fennelliae]